MTKVCLFDYQKEMLRRISAELAKPPVKDITLPGGKKVKLGRSIMVQMPTGTGKTYLMAAVIRRVRSKGEIWIIAHRRELVEQMKETLTRFGITFSEGKDADGRKKAKVRVMSIQWLSRNTGKIKAQPGLIVIDEAHHSLAATYQNLWGTYPQTTRLGFTATPCRMRKESFTLLWDYLLTSWSIKEFIHKGRLALYDYVVIGRDSEEQIIIDSFEKRGADGDFSKSEMEKKLNITKAISRLYRSVDKYAHGKKGIVYAIDINHAKRIADYYAGQGLRAVAIDSKTPAAQRAQMVDDFKRGKTDCIVNVNLFDEGFDCPDVEFIQMARPTLSLAKYMQMIGRGLRTHPDKKMCVLIDNAGLYRMFGLPDAERDWLATFKGKAAGKGCPDKLRRQNIRIVCNDMEIVANHSRMLPQSAEEQDKFFEKSEPFEENGRWGLRVGDEVILKPFYLAITPFVGKYCTFEHVTGLWGILLRNGRQYIPANFKKIELLPNGDATLIKNEISRRTVHLDTTLTDKKDIWEWWG